MKKLIQERLLSLEQEHNIKILHACESGSRAWGFPSPDSDYDVRFVYVHNLDWYLSIDDKKDTIELPINDVLDISGWELRKALKLFRKSNVPLLEHMQSHIIYSSYSDFQGVMLENVQEYFSPRAALHHYMSMARSTMASFDGEKVKLKKYFYALRTVLASLWIVEYSTMPPLLFSKLLELVSDKNLNKSIKNLLVVKANENETYSHKREMEIEKYVTNLLDYCELNQNNFKALNTSTEKLDKLFRNYLDLTK